MVTLLTIVLMIFIGWTLYGMYLLIGTGQDMELNFEYDGLLITLAKLHLWLFFIIIGGLILYDISFSISKSIVCDYKNNDNALCQKETIIEKSAKDDNNAN